MSEPDFIRISTDTPEPPRVREVADHLRREGLIAYPTETVYGFGCILREAPLARLYRLKRAGAAKPLLLLIGDRDDAASLVWPEGAEALAEAFWPGPLTLVLPDPGRRFPDEVRSERGGVAVRISPHPVIRAILAEVGEPITSTSANAPGKPPALSAEGAWSAAQELIPPGELRERLRVVDGGTLVSSESSTIVDFTGARAIVRRRGVLSPDSLNAVHPEIDDSEISG